MSGARLAEHHLLLVPGGNFIDMDQSIGPRTAAKAGVPSAGATITPASSATTPPPKVTSLCR
jgi:hypothetical protein